MKEGKNIAIIFAGGKGDRMGADIPKQFLKIYGKEIIIHTLEKFQYNDNIDLIYVGCIKEYIEELEKLVKRYNITKIPMGGIIPGGTSGQDTIYKVLKKAHEENFDNSICLIHDGVRPLIGDKLINDNIVSVKKYGSAVTATNLFETPFISEDGEVVNNVLERNKVYIAKAPQSFYLGDIIKAHEKIRNTELGYKNPKIVDSCSLMMECGMKVHLVPGNRGNIKVTTVEDYIALLANLSVKDQEQIYKLNHKEN